MKQVKCELFCDNFQNYKRYGIPKAQLVIADIPYLKKIVNGFGTMFGRMEIMMKSVTITSSRRAGGKADASRRTMFITARWTAK